MIRFLKHNPQTIFLAALFVFCIVPRSASASAQPYFGGLDDVVIPCTCSAGYTWNFFAPLYRSVVPAPTVHGAPDIIVPGALVAPLTPTLFSNYSIHIGVWAIGTQIPNVGICQMYVGESCVSLPNYGLITPFTGTSLSAGK